MDKLLSIFYQCVNSVEHGIIALAVGFVLFTLMERLFVVSRQKKPWRATLLDLEYAFLSMLYSPFIYFILSAIFGYLALVIRISPANPNISWTRFAAELAGVLLARDCLIYLRHRIFHLKLAWTFHSIHHSSEEVNWLSAVRFHPVENMIESVGEILLFLGAGVIGVDPLVLSVASIMMGLYNLFIHSNLRWTFGPLRYVFVSPVFHRWHHSDLPEALDKNFAAMFSCIDLALGTYYMPANLIPETTGLSVEEKVVHPRTLAGQLWYPFRRR